MNRQAYEDATTSIGFCEIEMIDKIQKLNTESLHNDTIKKLCIKFFESESGIECINLFETIVIEYHKELKD